MVFCHENGFYFYVLKCVSFSFTISGLLFIIRKTSFSLKIKVNSLKLSSYTCTVSFFFTFKSLIHLEFILICGVKYKSNFIIFQMANQLSFHQLLKFHLGRSDLKCHLYCILRFHMILDLFLDFLFGSTGVPVYSCARTTLLIIEPLCMFSVWED